MLWVLGISVAVTLASCASLGATTGSGGVAMSPPDVSADTTRAIQEFESCRKADALEGRNWLGPARRPDLDHDVTQGKQSRGLNRAIGR